MKFLFLFVKLPEPDIQTQRSLGAEWLASLAEGVVDPTVASRAKLAVGRAARAVGQEALQLHGGIGLTAEYPVGHYVSRLTAIEHALGDSETHLRSLAAGVASYEMVLVTG